MSIATEILTFLGGCLFYAFRGAVGKVLLAGLIKFAKVMFKITADDAALYKQHKTEHVAKRSNKARAR